VKLAAVVAAPPGQPSFDRPVVDRDRAVDLRALQQSTDPVKLSQER
jgi:hypothetical protein